VGQLTEWWRAQREAARQTNEIVNESHAALKQKQKQDQKQRAQESAAELWQRDASWKRMESSNWQHRLGVEIREGEVYEWPSGKHLGPLAGARAGMTDPMQNRGEAAAMAAVFGLVGLAAGGESRAATHVTLTNGAVVITDLDRSKAIARAQTDVVRFNALAQ
jgi:hypothetical protein